jgi:acyl dehydratase
VWQKEEKLMLNLNAAGEKIGPLVQEYTWKETVLYALGVGAGFGELEYCYEKRLKVIPSFSAALIFDFFFQAARLANVTPAGLLHGEQELIFHQPLPSGGKLITGGEITGFYDKGKDRGAVVAVQSHSSDADGTRLFTSSMTLFARMDGGFGGKNVPLKPVEFPNAGPDAVVEARPAPDQPLLYRLSGDLFALHVDPGFARLAGFDRPIMHGLCTHGFACRALIQTLVPGEPERLRRMACRFSKPLYPGVPIKTLIWKTGQGKALWRTVNAQNQDVVIDRGEVEFE